MTYGVLACRFASVCAVKCDDFLHTITLVGYRRGNGPGGGIGLERTKYHNSKRECNEGPFLPEQLVSKHAELLTHSRGRKGKKPNKRSDIRTLACDQRTQWTM